MNTSSSCCWYSFQNALASTHLEWVEAKAKQLRGGRQPVMRHMLRHNAMEAWQTMIRGLAEAFFHQ